MHDNLSPSDTTRGGSAAVGFLVGAAVGAGVALLLAPASGEQTRRRLGRAAGDLRKQLDKGVDQARERLSEVRNDVGSALDAGREAYTREREARSRDTDAADRTAST